MNWVINLGAELVRRGNVSTLSFRFGADLEYKLNPQTGTGILSVLHEIGALKKWVGISSVTYLC